jgi:hypothetical protein
MAPKKIVKRIKRSLPPKKKDGFDARLVALGAIGGAVAGRRVGASRAMASAANDVRRAVRSTPSPTGQVDNAMDMYRSEYDKMPRVDGSNKITTYNKILEETGNPKLARERSGMSAADVKLYKNKQRAKENMNIDISQRSAARSGVAAYPQLNDVMGATTRLRQNRTVPGGRRSGGIKGGIGGAALATLAQLVARELNKK